jgi:hypothetical protein
LRIFQRFWFDAERDWSASAALATNEGKANVIGRKTKNIFRAVVFIT